MLQAVFLEGVLPDVEERDEEAQRSQREENGVGDVFGHLVSKEGNGREHEPIREVVGALHDDVANNEGKNAIHAAHYGQISNGN